MTLLISNFLSFPFFPLNPRATFSKSTKTARVCPSPSIGITILPGFDFITFEFLFTAVLSGRPPSVSKTFYTLFNFSVNIDGLVKSHGWTFYDAINVDFLEKMKRLLEITNEDIIATV